MGIRNLRAICPNCGAKIHTQPKGLGHVSLWMNSGPLVKTGTQCPMCGVALTGRVMLAGNVAELADQGSMSLGPSVANASPGVVRDPSVVRARPEGDPNKVNVLPQNVRNALEASRARSENLQHMVDWLHSQSFYAVTVNDLYRYFKQQGL